jgi:hypothetical protein
MKPLFLTQHARDAIEEREIDSAWIERTVRTPDWAVSDAVRPGVERRFRVIPEYGNRVLRVGCYETTLEIRILTVFFDRDAKRP